MIPHAQPVIWPDWPSGRHGVQLASGSGELGPVESEGRAIGLLGIPDDTGVALNSGRTGAREGPAAFRRAIARYGASHPLLSQGSPSASPVLYDMGDVIPGGDLAGTHQRVTEATAAVVALGLFPAAIGGGHDLTFPFVRGALAAQRISAGVYLDAHLDVRPEPGSGMSFRRLVEDCGIERLVCVGFNPLANAEEHRRWFCDHGGTYDPFPPDSWPNLDDHFFSIDLDGIGGAFAPGVSAVNPTEGILPSQAAAYAYRAGKNSRVRCFDIMELNPLFDQGGRTALLAAHLFLSFLDGFAGR